MSYLWKLVIELAKSGRTEKREVGERRGGRVWKTLDVQNSLKKIKQQLSTISQSSGYVSAGGKRVGPG